MKICIAKYNIEIELKENRGTHIVIENPEIFSDIVLSIIEQSKGQEGCICLIDNADIISIDKKADLIINPFSVDCNEKRVISKIYKDLEKSAYDNNYPEISNITSYILKFIDCIIEDTDISLTSKDSLDIQGLLKLMDVRVNTISDSLLERLIEYIRVISDVCGFEIFFFVNINNYLSVEDIKYLNEFLLLKKIYFVNISGSDYEIDPCDKKIIIDKDKCIIEI